MRIRSLFSAFMVVVLCLVVAVPNAFGSGDKWGPIGPSNGQIAGVIAGVAVGIVVIAIVIYHEARKHPTIVGCVNSGADGLSLADKQNGKVYALSGSTSSLNGAEQVALKGKKGKDSSGKPTFEVEKLSKDFGACTP